jgi:hypothetical protein
MATSSQIIKDVVRKKVVVPLCFEKLQIVLSPSFIEILNLECAVCPLGMIEVAIPDVVVATTIDPIERTLASNTLYKNVVPVPPGPSTKKNPTSLIYHTIHN